jgi:hypothetical protein
MTIKLIKINNNIVIIIIIILLLPVWELQADYLRLTMLNPPINPTTRHWIVFKTVNC